MHHFFFFVFGLCLISRCSFIFGFCHEKRKKTWCPSCYIRYSIAKEINIFSSVKKILILVYLLTVCPDSTLSLRKGLWIWPQNCLRLKEIMQIFLDFHFRCPGSGCVIGTFSPRTRPPSPKTSAFRSFTPLTSATGP